MHHDVQGLSSKMCEISQWLHTCFGSPTVLCCSELWVKHNYQPITIPGFDMFMLPFLSHPNFNGSQLPGACMFVSSTPAPTRNGLCEKIEAIPVVLNTCYCFIHCKSQTVAVLSLYRSPLTSVQSALWDL